MGTAFPLLKCLRTHKTHLKLRKNKNGLIRLLPYAKSRVVVQLTLTKIIKIVANRWRILWLKCTKFDFGWGSAPASPPRWGSLQHPRPPSCIWGPISIGRGGVERGGEGGERSHCSCFTKRPLFGVCDYLVRSSYFNFRYRYPVSDCQTEERMNK